MGQQGVLHQLSRNLLAASGSHANEMQIHLVPVNLRLLPGLDRPLLMYSRVSQLAHDVGASSNPCSSVSQQKIIVSMIWLGWDVHADNPGHIRLVLL